MVIVCLVIVCLLLLGLALAWLRSSASGRPEHLRRLVFSQGRRPSPFQHKRHAPDCTYCAYPGIVLRKTLSWTQVPVTPAADVAANARVVMTAVAWRGHSGACVGVGRVGKRGLSLDERECELDERSSERGDMWARGRTARYARRREMGVT